MESWSYPKLKVAPCRYRGSAYLDDLIIAAHNYDRHFGRINTLLPGHLGVQDVVRDQLLRQVQLLQDGDALVQGLQRGLGGHAGPAPAL